MSKIGFVFPGQGAQHLGMGRDFFNEYDIVKEIFKEASNELDIDMEELIFYSSEDELKKTENTQPAILTVSYSILKVLGSMGISSHISAGLSLGEYVALIDSGALDFKSAVKLVRSRGKYMQEAVPEGKGSMAAILGLSRDDVENVINNFSEKGVLEVANYNAPGQIVIAGEKDLVENSLELFKEKGAKKATLLPVSAPFHTSLLKPAGEKLKKDLDLIKLNEMKKPIVSNVDAMILLDSKDVKRKLQEQVSNSVLWQDSINTMIENDVTTFIEMGPGKSVSSFIKRICKEKNHSAEIMNISNIDGLNKTLEKLKVSKGV